MNGKYLVTFETLTATHNSAVFMAGIVVLLLTATLIHTVLQKIHPQKNFDDLRLRTRSWWIMIAVLFAALLGGRTTAIVFFALLSYLALKEFMSIIPTRQVNRRAVFWAYLAIPFQYYWVADAWYAMFIVFIPVFMFLVIPTRLVLTGETQGFIKNSLGTYDRRVFDQSLGLPHRPAGIDESSRGKYRTRTLCFVSDTI